MSKRRSKRCSKAGKDLREKQTSKAGRELEKCGPGGKKAASRKTGRATMSRKKRCSKAGKDLREKQTSKAGRELEACGPHGKPIDKAAALRALSKAAERFDAALRPARGRRLSRASACASAAWELSMGGGTPSAMKLSACGHQNASGAKRKKAKATKANPFALYGGKDRKAATEQLAAAIRGGNADKVQAVVEKWSAYGAGDVMSATIIWDAFASFARASNPPSPGVVRECPTCRTESAFMGKFSGHRFYYCHACDDTFRV